MSQGALFFHWPGMENHSNSLGRRQRGFIKWIGIQLSFHSPPLGLEKSSLNLTWVKELTSPH